MPHNITKEKLTDLMEQTFNRNGSIYLACNDIHTFSLLNSLKDIICGHIRKFVTLSISFWQYILRFGSKLYKILQAYKLALTALLLLQIYFVIRETSCCLFLTIFKAFYSTSRYLDDLMLILNKW